MNSNKKHGVLLNPKSPCNIIIRRRITIQLFGCLVYTIRSIISGSKIFLISKCTVEWFHCLC
ncbi:hypothetical protein HanRHA438_Chr09g0408691 [Helianthus annuus]|nr:hypothetical protein HanRHA438_Chr09g0408691 [Helianthus annuus]